MEKWHLYSSYLMLFFCGVGWATSSLADVPVKCAGIALRTLEVETVGNDGLWPKGRVVPDVGGLSAGIYVTSEDADLPELAEMLNRDHRTTMAKIEEPNTALEVGAGTFVGFGPVLGAADGSDIKLKAHCEPGGLKVEADVQRAGGIDAELRSNTPWRPILFGRLNVDRVAKVEVEWVLSASDSKSQRIWVDQKTVVSAR